MADAHKPPSACIGVGVASSERATGPPLRRRSLGDTDGEAVRDGIDPAASRKASRTVGKLGRSFG